MSKKNFDDHLDEALERTLKETLAIVKGRAALRYDGIVGSLFASWPEHHRTEFETARDWLLRRVSHTDALRYLNEFAKVFDPDYNGRPTVPLAYQATIHILHYYWKAMKLGELRGLRMVAGNDAASGYKSRMAHQHRDDYWDKEEVKKIGLKLYEQNHSLTIAAIERSPELMAYRRKYKGKNTIRTWLKQIEPLQQNRKPGRPRKTL
jgi:hypothetical protein